MISRESISLFWDKPHFYEGSTLFIPQILDCNSPIDAINCSNFNTRVVGLEGGMRGSLDWRAGRELATRYVEEGFKLLWEIDLGLDGKLQYPLGNSMQHQALRLALHHFSDTLWKDFQGSSLGLVLYRGSVDYSLKFPWDEQQRNHFAQSQSESEALYCSNVMIDYMQLLAMHLPDALRLFVLLDCREVRDPLLLSQLISREKYQPFHLALQGCPFSDQELVWAQGRSQWGFVAAEALSLAATEVKTAFILPSSQRVYPHLRQSMEKLLARGESFRVIPESLLLTEWDGLDQLYYCEEALTPSGKRMLQGFIAAGGLTISLSR